MRCFKLQFTIGRVIFFKEMSAFDSPCWVAVGPEHIYFAVGFWSLAWTVLTEWKHDKHLVG